VPAIVEIGRGAFLSSGGIGTVVDRGVKIGVNCIISPCVSIELRDNRDGAPVVEDDCFIGAGDRVLGPFAAKAEASLEPMIRWWFTIFPRDPLRSLFLRE
jgi:serine acetyltransferase